MFCRVKCAQAVPGYRTYLLVWFDVCITKCFEKTVRHYASSY